MEGTNFRLLIGGVHVVPADLEIPEVVIDEVVNRYREDLDQAISRVRKSSADLERLLGRSVGAEFAELNAATEAQEYRMWFLAALERIGAEILPYPEIQHKEVVERDLQRRKPFKRDGSGYRDLLIWECIKRLLRRVTDQVIFVTGDMSDFAEGDALAPDLHAEILNPQRLEILPSLKAFNEKFVLPRLEMLEEVRNRLQTGVDSPFDIEKWLQMNLMDLIPSDELGPIVAGFPYGVGSGWARQIVALHRISVDEVRELGSGQRFVRLSVEVDVEVSIDIDWEDYIRYPEVREWVGEKSEPFTYSSSQGVERLTVCVELILDAATSELVVEELVAIDGPYGSVELTSS